MSTVQNYSNNLMNQSLTTLYWVCRINSDLALLDFSWLYRVVLCQFKLYVNISEVVSLFLEI